MKILSNISLDFARNTMPITLFAKQFDNDTREIVITPLDRGQPYILEDGITARLQIKKPDDTQVINDAAIAGGKITAELTQQALAASGLATAEIGLYKGETLLTSQTFYIDIMPAAYDPEKVESTDEYNSLLQATAAAEKATAEAEKWKNVTADIEAVAPESDPEITLSDTEDGKHFDFKIPRGQKGDKGEQGEQGAKGDKGEKGDKGDPGEGVSIVQTTGDSTEDVMSQKAVTDALNEHKGVNVVQTTGDSETDVMSQKAVTEALKSGGGGTSINVVQETGDSTEDVMSQNAVTVAIKASHGSGNVITESVNAHADGQENTIDTSDYATAHGHKNSLDGSAGGTAMGEQNQVNGSAAGTAVGSQNTVASSDYAIAGGYKNAVNGSQGGVALGENNQLSQGQNGVSIGSGNVIGGTPKGMTIGDSNKIFGGENSFAIGTGNTINGSYRAFCIGDGNTITNSAETYCIGNYQQVKSTSAGNNAYTLVAGSTNVVNFTSGSGNAIFGVSNQFAGATDIPGVLARNLIFGGYNRGNRDIQDSFIGGNNNTPDTINKTMIFGYNNDAYKADNCVFLGTSNSLNNGANVFMIGTGNTGGNAFGGEAKVLVGNHLTAPLATVGPYVVIGKYNKAFSSCVFVIGDGTSSEPHNIMLVTNDRKVIINGDLEINGNLYGTDTSGTTTFISAKCAEGTVTVTETSGHGDKNSTFDATGSITLYDGENKGNGYQWYLGWTTAAQENPPAIRGFITKGGTKFVFGDVISPIGTPVDIKDSAGETLGTVVIDEEYNLTITLEGADDTFEATGFITSFRQ